MAKIYGVIGYADTVETSPGIWEEELVTRRYVGDLNRNSRRLESSGNVNDNVNISNEISIVADPYAMNNFHKMRYVEFMGAKWKIASVDASTRPRLILTIGGVYNG